ncbi:uncharacterized protein Z519_07214 [Cladophialophora bantiana CBS 173.52]|uniref:Cytochrome P450 n=1 Tax=Cladophialophora bantiana (strain ATCC 10958 / CBS 173.52 / CDC B-1940 / NIH 8579) TaxID=1442370 RepID=A0A0D2HN28_CLAB1|nr:uncharacterized protein Z519_07214 [Cladophialophora bantiana CBS 173.52]KIW92230.1 hypothetical protein Z519_07214 [Cladophialophora bantiana CBS 173.52]
MSWISILLTLYGLWVVSTLWNLFKNYLSARKTGLPIIIFPLNNYHPIWMIFSVPLRPLFERFLPGWAYEPINLATYGFEFRSKNAIFEKCGPAFILVTAGSNELSLMDPELASEVLKRIKDFPNTDIGGVILNIFGPSLITSDGENWARQRRLIAPNINEKISGLVFGESCRQAREMLASYMDDLRGVTDDTMRGMKQIAINVLGTAGFGISQPWKEEKSSRPKGYRTTYMEATKTVVENIIEAAVMPAKLLTLPIFAPSWQNIGHAKNEFPLHTREMLENERKLQYDSPEPRSNLMSMLVRLSDSSKPNGDLDSKAGELSKSPQVLSEEEILGNLFIFTSAGFDTTANTMAYALALLATYPEWQDWLYEEINTIVGARGAENLEYAEIYPRLPRCLALMLETMRFFPPLTHIAKQTNSTHDVSITTTSGKSYYIPTNTIIYINTVSLHLDPRTWGDDAMTFRPSRWLVSPDTAPSRTGAEYTIAQNIKSPPKGTFLPWSAGPRVCPGQKMSQVEFVSVFMTIFGKYRCEAVKVRDEETAEEVKQRLEAVMRDSQPKLTLQMMRNKDLKLRWIRR